MFNGALNRVYNDKEGTFVSSLLLCIELKTAWRTIIRERNESVLVHNGTHILQQFISEDSVYRSLYEHHLSFSQLHPVFNRKPLQTVSSENYR